MRKAGSRSFPDQFFGFLFVILLSVFVGISILDEAKGGERYLLKGGDPITVSLERGEAEEGWTPVRMDVQGLVLSFWMDEAGRVFGDKGRGCLLFRMDSIRRQMRTADWMQTGVLLERTPERLRFRFNDLRAALILNIKAGKVDLDLEGLMISVPVLFGPEADGVRELGIGDWRAEGAGHLCLDTRKKQLFWAPAGKTGRRDDSQRVTWAVS